MKTSKAQLRASKRYKSKHKYQARKTNYRSNGKLYIRKYATKQEILNFINFCKKEMNKKMNLK